MLGLRVAVPGEGTGRHHWPDDVDPVSWQAKPTIFDRARAAGITAYHVADGAYEATGLSRAALRGAAYRPARCLGGLAAEAVAALQDSESALVTVYTPDLDGAGHHYGVSSPAWTFQLAHVDKLAEQIAAALPMGAVLYVTADPAWSTSGRTTGSTLTRSRSCARASRWWAASRGAACLARPGAAADVLAAWQEVLGDHAWVTSRDEAIKDGGSARLMRRCATASGTWVAAAAGHLGADGDRVGTG